MFTIIGADGKEYGPVPTIKIQEWIAGGRANLQTRAKRDGETEFKSLGEFAEFNPPAGLTSPPPIQSTISPGPATVAAAPAVPADEPADRGIRLVAFLVDRAISIICAMPGMMVLGVAFLRAAVAASRGSQPDFSGIDAIRLLVGLILLCTVSLILAIVQICLLSTRGQTIGKILVGIRVVRFADGSKAGFVHAWLLRNFVPWVIQLIPYLGLLFFLVDSFFIFGAPSRCVHDFIADTKVVKVRRD